MRPSDDTRDEELLARYRQAGANAAGPSEAVRAAILAESRRAADELAKRAPPQTVDVSRPAANDSRWKITAFGTLGAALLAAFLFAPRYWENAPPAQVSMAPAPAPAPKLQEAAPPGPASDAAPVPPPSVARNYAPVAPAYSPLAGAPPAPAARVRPLDLPAHAAESAALSAGADRAARANTALKPLSLNSAVAQGDVAEAAALLDQGAVIDARDGAGRTPLMLAVNQDRLEIVRLLLARGADPNAADNTGHTPLQQATKRDLQDVAALLKQAGAR